MISTGRNAFPYWKTAIFNHFHEDRPHGPHSLLAKWINDPVSQKRNEPLPAEWGEFDRAVRDAGVNFDRAHPPAGRAPAPKKEIFSVKKFIIFFIKILSSPRKKRSTFSRSKKKNASNIAFCRIFQTHKNLQNL